MVMRRPTRAVASLLIRRARVSTALQCCWVLPSGWWDGEVNKKKRKMVSWCGGVTRVESY